MEIKTQDGERNVASKGLGGTALGLAIPGTVALANQLIVAATRCVCMSMQRLFLANW